MIPGRKAYRSQGQARRAEETRQEMTCFVALGGCLIMKSLRSSRSWNEFAV